MIEHRWSGWPGAWCLDCGIVDPIEDCLIEHDLDMICAICKESYPIDDGTADHLHDVTASLCTEHVVTPCKEPGSHRYDPYFTPPTTFEEL